MKLFNIGFVILIPIIFFTAIIFQTKPTHFSRVNPVSTKHDFYFQLNQVLNTSQLKPINLNIREYQNEIEFLIKNEATNKFTQVVLSTQKNPVWQVTSLQQALKIAKIKNTYIKKIDLSIKHPYATL
jgi:hypothetical protein